MSYFDRNSWLQTGAYFEHKTNNEITFVLNCKLFNLVSKIVIFLHFFLGPECLFNRDPVLKGVRRGDVLLEMLLKM